MPRRMTALAPAAVALALVPAATAWADVEVRADLRPGDHVRDHGVGVVVPPPGQFVTMDVLMEDGSQTVTASTRPDGTVELSSVGDEAERTPPPAHGSHPHEDGDEMTVMEPALGRAIPACDDHYHLFSVKDWSYGKPIRWRSTFRWWFRATTTPSYMSVDNVRMAIAGGLGNIVGVHDDCGYVDTVDFASEYLGDTTEYAPNIRVDGTDCTAPDGASVVSFGTLPLGRLAATCVWGYNEAGTFARITSSDIRINKAAYEWYAVKPSNCVDRYSVEGVMTHEFGHSLGLADVGPEDKHGWLTMSGTFNGPCQGSETTLGSGDVLGFAELY